MNTPEETAMPLIIPARTLTRLAIVIVTATALAGCETTGSTPSAQQAMNPAEKPAEPPMTRARAASICWMSAEKSPASMSVDKRADIVTKCIDDKMKTAQAAAPG
jgi:hypothetical protein